MECVANEENIESSMVIGFGAESYAILGGKIGATFDYGQLLNDWETAFDKFVNFGYIRWR